MTGSSERRAGFARGTEIAVGDWVGVDPEPTADLRTRILAVLPRRSAFRREAEDSGGASQIVAANLDTVMLCNALDGRLGLRHLERFLALMWQGGAAPVVLITKADAVPPAVVSRAVDAVGSVAKGVPVLTFSSQTGQGLDELKRYLLPGRTVGLVGLSGAGKSTLVNLLAGTHVLATGAVRRDGSGRHTTTHRELVVVPGGGLLIDTPGMRALSVAGAGDGIEQAFQDIEILARLCGYRNCSHAGEEGCEVAIAIADGRLDQARVDSWRRLKTEPASAGLEAARQGVEDRKKRKADKVAGRRAARK